VKSTPGSAFFALSFLGMNDLQDSDTLISIRPTIARFVFDIGFLVKDHVIGNYFITICPFSILRFSGSVFSTISINIPASFLLVARALGSLRSLASV
jgi:intracellular septation protein A